MTPDLSLLILPLLLIISPAIDRFPWRLFWFALRALRVLRWSWPHGQLTPSETSSAASLILQAPPPPRGGTFWCSIADLRAQVLQTPFFRNLSASQALLQPRETLCLGGRSEAAVLNVP